MALMSDQVPVYHVVPDGKGGWRLELAETISLEEFNRLRTSVNSEPPLEFPIEPGVVQSIKRAR